MPRKCQNPGKIEWNGRTIAKLSSRQSGIFERASRHSRVEFQKWYIFWKMGGSQPFVPVNASWEHATVLSSCLSAVMPRRNFARLWKAAKRDSHGQTCKKPRESQTLLGTSRISIRSRGNFALRPLYYFRLAAVNPLFNGFSEASPNPDDVDRPRQVENKLLRDADSARGSVDTRGRRHLGSEFRISSDVDLSFSLFSKVYPRDISKSEFESLRSAYFSAIRKPGLFGWELQTIDLRWATFPMDVKSKMAPEYSKLEGL